MRRRSISILMALIMMLASVQIASAADISGYFDKDTPTVVGKVVKAKFEKSGDEDCYSFVSGGGKYKLTVYSKNAHDEYGMADETDPYYGYEMPIKVDFGEYDFFSAAAGDPPSYMIGAIMSYGPLGVDKLASDGWYSCTIDLEKAKKGTKVAVRICGDYKGEYRFKITGKAALNPAPVTAKKATALKRGFKVKWAKVSKASGYEVKYATNKKFKNSRTVKVSKSSGSKTVKGLQSKKNYYVKVRAYRSVSGKRHPGAWSKTFKVKTK